MKRVGGLWDRLISWDNLLLAARKARRGKRRRPDVLRFQFRMEPELLALAEELSSGAYRPGAFQTHWVHRPKPRLISAAPFRDRVVHHALMNVIEPILDRRFHPDSYACRRRKGTHAAADRLQDLMRRNRYFFQCDVRKFFPSIDHEILKQTFRRIIKDRRTLALMDLIVDSSNPQELVLEWFGADDLLAPLARRRGLPIGNLTSQWFANWYLNDLDHFVTSRLGLGAYVRYCDDFILLHDDREALRRALAAVHEHLSARRLALHETSLSIRPVAAGAAFVGFRVWESHRLLRRTNVRAFRRRVRWMRRAYRDGHVGFDEIKIRIAGWLGHARQSDSRRLVNRLSREWIFVVRGAAESIACPARRFLEQQPEELPIRESEQEHARQPEQQHRVPCCPALPRLDPKPGIARITVRTSVGGEVLVPLLSRPSVAAKLTR